MPQITSWTIPNSGGSTYRAAVNTALSAIQSSSSGAAAPSPTVAGMLWYDTTTSILKRRNTANTAWVDVSSDTIAATTVRGNSSGAAAAEAAISMATLQTMLGFTQSLGINSYVKIPGGAIVQWGTGTTAATGLLTVTFPTAFPTACRSVNITPVTGLAWGATVSTFSASTFQAVTFASSTGAFGASNFFYIAAGN